MPQTVPSLLLLVFAAGSEGRSCSNVGYKNSLHAYPLALCLDGSPGAYYFSKGAPGSKKFLLHQEGGGSCFFQGTPEPEGGDRWEKAHECRHRALHEGDMGSTRKDPESMDLCNEPEVLCQAGFDRSPEKNPLFNDWNHVLIRYCDGGYFSGNHSHAGLHFRGAEILSSVLYDLVKEHNMGAASDVVLSGCSAGAIATFMNVDWVAQHPAMPAGVRFTAFPFEGYYMDDTSWPTGPYKGHKVEGIGMFAFLKRSAFEVHKPQVLNRHCLSHHPSNPYLCLIAQEGARFIESDLFFWQSKYDMDMLAWQPNYGIYERKEGVCLRQGGDSQNKADIDVDCAKRLGDRMTTLVQDLWDSKSNIGGFLDGCYHHCPSLPHGNRIDGKTALEAFAEWYAGGRRTWLAENVWPAESCWDDTLLEKVYA